MFMENAKRSPCGNDQCYSSLIKENEDKETRKWFVLQFLVLLISLHTQHTPEELLQSPQSLLDISFVRLSRLILTAIHSCGRLHTTTDQLSLRERETLNMDTAIGGMFVCVSILGRALNLFWIGTHLRSSH